MRSIPACAGEPIRSSSLCCGGSVYPRVCGGTSQVDALSLPEAGLSPRVRGNQRGRARTPPRPRSIPACAGEPCWSRGLGQLQRVYPRVCGGTCFGFVFALLSSGLSPRVRGNQIRVAHKGKAMRSIPACAGEPPVMQLGTTPQKVYPRVCGGTAAAGEASVSPKGLSPRVRGNHRRHPADRRPDGSIPACAGEPAP